MNAPNIYYVYEHWRPDTGVCFYVGKGKGKRAWHMSGSQRSRAHRAVQSRLIALGMTVQVKIVIADIAEETAFCVERDRIKQHGRANLVNQSDGGEGPSGRKATAEDKAKISAAHKGRKQTKEWISARVAARRAADNYKMSPELRSRLTALSTGRAPSAKTRAKASASGKGRKHPPETIEKMKRAAKLRGIPRSTIEAGAASRRGKPRVPHRPESKELMRIAAIEREAKKRARREVG